MNDRQNISISNLAQWSPDNARSPDMLSLERNKVTDEVSAKPPPDRPKLRLGQPPVDDLSVTCQISISLLLRITL